MLRAVEDFEEIRKHLRPSSPSAVCPRRDEACVENCAYLSQCLQLRERLGVLNRWR